MERKLLTNENKSVLLVFGEYSAKMGGPIKTIQAYSEVLQQLGYDVSLFGLATTHLESISDASMSLYPYSRWSFRSYFNLAGELCRRREHTFMIFGVWHTSFFVLGFLKLFRLIKSDLLLFPTQSLTPWSWKQHPVLKALLKPILYLILTRVRGVIFSSVGESQNCALRIDQSKIHVIYHPTPQTQLPTIESSLNKHIVFVGRIVPQKDVFLFLESFKLLPEDWTAEIIGTGERSLILEIRHFLAISHLTKRVNLTGWLDKQQVLEKINSSFALVVTSVEENYCHVAIEAMSVKTLVISVSRICMATDFRQLNIAQITMDNPLDISAQILDSYVNYPNQVVSNAKLFAAQRQDGTDLELIDCIINNKPQ